jgi:uncharacterized protein (TIGR02217 family)
MSFINTRMPERLLAGFVIGPRWKTSMVDMDNGRENPNADWMLPKYEAKGQLGALNAADRLALRNLFMACRGRKNAFRVKDPLDYVATAQPLVTVGGVVYLSRTYTFGSESAYRLIQAPVTATLSGAGSVDLETGIVTGADPEVDTWTGTFDIWMRFESDWNAVNAITPQAVSADIELVERRR